jgi:hypothetical protein
MLENPSSYNWNKFKLKSGTFQNPEDVIITIRVYVEHISKRTAQDWRKKKIIGFFQIGNKIYYRLSDVKNY